MRRKEEEAKNLSRRENTLDAEERRNEVGFGHQVQECHVRMVEMKGRIEELSGQVRRLLDEKAELEGVVFQRDKEIKELSGEVKRISEKVQDRENEIEGLISKVKEALRVNQHMLIQLNNLKEYIESVKVQNAELKEENDHIKMTIGTNYYDLTPRPDWRHIADGFKEFIIKGRFG